jgi:hypothetical protein
MFKLHSVLCACRSVPKSGVRRHSKPTEQGFKQQYFVKKKQDNRFEIKQLTANASASLLSHSLPSEMSRTIPVSPGLSSGGSVATPGRVIEEETGRQYFIG